ncbi:hypothetical protein RN001_001580 [Aquatica leii]|uniref:Uncharacterized protein n=1 Tax=Aquatica leii TaxID=1421715 RepID=A0AAN7PG38_9COLE|nr:hypothetical protein RN001_001580 [Aquatica leii]
MVKSYNPMSKYSVRPFQSKLPPHRIYRILNKVISPNPSHHYKSSDVRRQDRGRRRNEQPDQIINGPATNNEPTERVLSNLKITTKEGKPRQRMTWTREMNITVMRCYYTATQLEQISIGYRPQLYNLFTETYPELTNIITPQRLVDQKRVILTNKRLTDEDIQNIKEEIATELDGKNTRQNNFQTSLQTTTTTIQNTELPETPATSTLLNKTPHTQTPRFTNTNSIDRINDELQTNIIKWTGINPENRLPLPKLIYKKDTNTIINTVNTLIEKHLHNTSTIEDIHQLVYIAAITVITQNKQLTQNRTSHERKQSKPKWQIRLENKINNIRKDLGRLTQYCKGNHTKQVTKHIRHIINNSNNKETPTEALDTLKQKLALYTTRLKRYKEANKRKTQNTQYNRNENYSTKPRKT